MRRRELLKAIGGGIIAAPAIIRPASAWLIQGAACGSTYIGPGDIAGLGITMFLGVAAYNIAYAIAQGNALDLRRSSDNSTMTATIACSTGFIDTTAISAWAGADTIFITKAYDQTGNGNDEVQASTTSQPTLALSGGLGNRPYIVTATSKTLARATNYTPATGVGSFAAVGLRTGTAAPFFVAPNSVTRNSLAGNDQGIANRWMLKRGAVTTARLNAVASDNAWHKAQGVMNGASSVLAIDGTDTTGTISGSTDAGLSNFASSASGGCSEAFYADNTAWSGTDRTNINNNMTTRYA